MSLLSIRARAACRRLPLMRDVILAIQERDAARWRARGDNLSSSPLPGAEKRRVLLQLARQAKVVHVVETGTFLGDTTDAFARAGYEVTSIEVQPVIASLAMRRFRSKSKVRILQGDSGVVLPRVLEGINGPSLIWLDGHYSGGGTGRGAEDTPIEREVQAVLRLAKAGSIVVVDDARCFGSDPSYPPLQPWLDRLAEAGFRDVSVTHDMIRFKVPAGFV